MVSVQRPFLTETRHQVPPKLDALQFLKRSIESYENWKTSQKKQICNVLTNNEQEVSNDPKNIRGLHKTNKGNAYKKPRASFDHKIILKTQTNTNTTKKEIQFNPTLKKTISNSPSNKKLRENKSKPQESSSKGNDHLIYNKSTNDKNNEASKEERLCCDNSKPKGRKETYKICKPKGKRKRKVKEMPQQPKSSVLEEPTLQDESRQESNIIPDIQKRQAKHIRPNISELLMNLQKMGVDEIEAEMLKFANPQSPQSSNLMQRSTTNESNLSSQHSCAENEPPISDKSSKSIVDEVNNGPESINVEVPMTCKNEDLKALLIESNYTKSEMEILLDELRSFPTLNEAVERFDEMVPDFEEVPLPYVGLEEVCSSDYHSINEEEGDDIFSDEVIENELVEEENYTGDDEVEDESDKEASLKQPSAHEKPITASQKLQGILYNAMSRYYSSRVEGLMSIEDYIDEKNEKEFHDILFNAIKEYGLPQSEEALKSFLSKVMNQQPSAGMDPLKAADYYESIHLKKIGRGEKYIKTSNSCLIDLFGQKYPVDRDLFELLAPHLQTTHEEIKANKETKTNTKKRKKKRKKKIVEEIDTGPFNILLRSGVRNKVWRSALKKLKKKTDVLKKTIEHKLKSGLPYEKYHQHFAEYFKNKRKEIKRLRKNRKTSTLLKARTLDLSEAESTTSLSSGEFYPEKELMNSILHDYQETSEFPVPCLERKRRKLGKREKLKKEKLHERSGCGGGIKGSPNTPAVEKTWAQKAIKKSYKRRARVVEEYLYSSCDELTGLKGPPQKDEKQVAIKELADQLLKEPLNKICSDNKITKETNQLPKENKTEELKHAFFLACSKYKMLYVYELIERYKVLKSPYDEAFKMTTLKIMYGIEPYDVLGSYNKAMSRKLLKMAVRTILGMFYMAQKELSHMNKSETDAEIPGCDVRGEDNLNLPLNALIANATIQRERHSKWLRQYFGIEHALKTERRMPLYFGPSEEAWLNIGPMEKKKV